MLQATGADHSSCDGAPISRCLRNSFASVPYGSGFSSRRAGRGARMLDNVTRRSAPLAESSDHEHVAGDHLRTRQIAASRG